MCSSMTANMCIAEGSGGSNEIKVFLNGEKLEFDVNPYIKNSRTLVPFRKIFEAFGLEVQWNDTRKTVLAKGKTEISLKIDDRVAYVNGLRRELDVPPEITNSRTFVPLRFIGESMGATVDWNNETKTISITYANTTKNVGESVVLGDLNLSIDKVDIDYEAKTYLVTGKVNTDSRDLYVYMYEDSEKYVYAKFEILEKVGDSFNFECGRYRKLKIDKANYIYIYDFIGGKKIKVAEYIINK
jgi:hypothetical protein